jgi:signal-transduction protein with cAMP-binding, CBS, and nucleotidyltransferase domain
MKIVKQCFSEELPNFYKSFKDIENKDAINLFLGQLEIRVLEQNEMVFDYNVHGSEFFIIMKGAIDVVIPFAKTTRLTPETVERTSFL